MLHKVYPQPADMYPRVWSVYTKAWVRQTKTEEHILYLYIPTLYFLIGKFFFNSLNVFC